MYTRLQRRFAVASVVLACSIFSVVSSAATAAKKTPLPVDPPKPPVLREFSQRLVVPSQGANFCAGDASALATKFASFTTAQNVAANCMGEQTVTDAQGAHAVHVITITYKAEREILPYRAIYGGSSFMGAPDAYNGLFASYNDCLKAVADQTIRFTENTGLPAFVGYCQQGDSVSAGGFSPVIEGYGTPTTRLRVFRVNEMLSNEDYTAVNTEAAPLIQKYDGAVVYTDAVRIFFYGKNSVQVSTMHGPSFSKTADCVAELPNLWKMYSAIKDADVTTVCNGTEGYVSAYAVGVKANAITESYSHSDPYFSYADCQTDGPRVIANAKSRGSRVVGFVCSPSFSAGKYDMHLYEMSYYSPLLMRFLNSK